MNAREPEDALWSDLDEELAAVHPAMELRRHPYLSSDRYTMYMARFSSLGHYRVTGYLSIPTRSAPSSGLLELPSRYGSVVHVPHPNDRERHVVLTLMHRGQRLSDVPLKGSFPGFFTTGIEDPRSWVYRGVLADAIRAAEVLASIDEVDPARIGAVGDDSTVVVAARRRSLLRAIRVDSLRLSRAWDRRSSTDAYPLEELNELARRDPAAAECARKTLAAFDPVAGLARQVEIPALVTVPETAVPGPYDELIAGLTRGERFETAHFEYEHDDARDAWISAQLGVEAMTRFDHVAGRRGQLPVK